MTFPLSQQEVAWAIQQMLPLCWCNKHDGWECVLLGQKKGQSTSFAPDDLPTSSAHRREETRGGNTVKVFLGGRASIPNTFAPCVMNEPSQCTYLPIYMCSSSILESTFLPQLCCFTETTDTIFRKGWTEQWLKTQTRWGEDFCSEVQNKSLVHRKTCPYPRLEVVVCGNWPDDIQNVMQIKAYNVVLNVNSRLQRIIVDRCEWYALLKKGLQQ